MRGFAGILPVLCSIAIPAFSQTISTVAGTGVYGSSGDNGPATLATVDTVRGIAIDTKGNIYISDSRNHRIRKIAGSTITTVAGTGKEGFAGDGSIGTSAQLSYPRGLALDAQGNLYIADTGNSRIRMLSAGGIITTVAGNGTAGFGGDGGKATLAQLNYPRGVTLDANANLYIADSWNFRVRKISGGNIQTVAGNGSSGLFGDGGAATAASLGLVDSVTTDGLGNLYLSDPYQHVVRKVAADGTISTLAGGGFGAAVDGLKSAPATLMFPKGLAADTLGNLFVADAMNQRVRKILPNGVITSVAGTGTSGYTGDGAASAAAQLRVPSDIALDSQNNLYIGDMLNYRVRKVTGWPTGPSVVSVLNSAGSQPIIAGGAFAQISGTNLSSKTDTWNGWIVNSQLPTQVDGVSVTVAGKAAYIYYVSPGQINIIAPAVSAGTVAVQVTNAGVTSAPFNVTAQQYSPAFFLWGGDTYTVATHPDYSACARTDLIPGYPTTPAKPGEWITFWGNGFGPTDLSLGIVTPTDKAHSTTTVTATVGGIDAQVYGSTAYLTGGAAGLYQIAIQIPSTIPDGDVPVKAIVGGVSTPDNVFITVKR